MDRLDQRRQAAARRLGSGEAGMVWNRLTAVDFFGNSFQLAALAILCFFPFLIVVTAAAGRDAVAVVVGWLGLDQQAAQAVATLFKTSPGPGTLTVTSACLLVLGAMAVAGTLQSWYRKVFDVPGGGCRDVAAQLLWLAALLVYGAVQVEGGRALGSVGGPVLQGLFGLVLAVVFWWWSLEVLLAGAVRWRALFPAALATGLCWTGLGVFSALYFSEAIVANEHSYGPIGVVMTILSWLVAVGVVVHLGAVVGRLYVEHRDRPAPAAGGPPQG
ncbi:YhjD/YihY/BrkB family envelope integrity protein [Peterkaempfera sp. SMS 1(5)a]|uniref:YhjD/YihY/BrkB family envelope integrity protein n=1 Tax=Peterkaempfera podocarpi TaxID=3232308 RepID=UPI003673207B